jgi:chemotaxis protein methyltransferase CheR
VTGKVDGVPLAELERIVEGACGLALSDGLRRTLADAFRRAAREAGISPAAFLARLRTGEPRSVDALVDEAVVGETYFFRRREQLAALHDLLFRTAPASRPLAIWSAGCATGEEPFTLAMALHDAGRPPRDRVLATDVSARALAVAREGVYGEWSLRRLDPDLRGRHFVAQPPRLLVRPDLRRVVELRRHNLVSDPAPDERFDLVVCRNVLIYFAPATAAAVAGRLAGALRPGGLLLLGPVESHLADGLGLEREESRGAVLHRRPVRSGAVRGAPPVARRAERSDPLPAPSEPAAAVAQAEGLAAARAAAHDGDVAGAERLARETAARHRCPESWLLVSMAADARGDLDAALDAARRALDLAPDLALGHAALVPLYARLGRPRDAVQARLRALEAIVGLDDGAPLRGGEIITAGALRRALGGERDAGRGTGP